MRCDGDSDHCVGNSELEILAHRLDLIEGVPFTSQELCHQFGLEDDQSLLKLADVFLTLYIKKRREQVATNAKEGPRLGRSFIWKCEIDGLGVIAWELLKTKWQSPQKDEGSPDCINTRRWLFSDSNRHYKELPHAGNSRPFLLTMWLKFMHPISLHPKCMMWDVLRWSLFYYCVPN